MVVFFKRRGWIFTGRSKSIPEADPAPPAREEKR